MLIIEGIQPIKMIPFNIKYKTETKITLLVAAIKSAAASITSIAILSD